MKPIIIIISTIAFMFSLNLCLAQDLENKVNHSEVVIEGHIVSSKGFKTPKSIFTSYTVRVLKVFKGSVTDSTIEISSEGGQVDGEGLDVIDGRSFSVEKDDEGIFLLDNNATDNRLQRELHSYTPIYGEQSLIRYNGNTAESLEKGLFKQIESITGQKRKVLGLNTLEKPAKFSLESKVANSDLIIEGVVLSRVGFRSNKSANYASALVKVSKLFKGEVTDSIIELVYLDGGTDGALRDSYGLNLNKDETGIFFLTKNNTHISQNSKVQSFIPNFGKRSLAIYKWAGQSTHSYMATCDKTIYVNVETDLFPKLEALTGQNRIIFRKNIFETN